MTIAFIVDIERDAVNVFTFPQHYLTAGESGSVRCIVQVSSEHPIKLIDNRASAMLTLYHDGKEESSNSFSNLFTPLVLSQPFTTVKLSNAGNWTCSYYLDSRNLFIQSSKVKTNITNAIVKSKCKSNNDCLLATFYSP